MHELSIAYDIFATAKHAADEHRAKQVTKVVVDLGELTMVNPEQVEFLFSTFCEEDPAFTETILQYRTVKPKVRCRCGYEGDELYVCPKCGSLPEIVQGREIVVTNIEIEVD
jgi:hydrogenase nickel incorporation protein HypA/HybF